MGSTLGLREMEELKSSTTDLLRLKPSYSSSLYTQLTTTTTTSTTTSSSSPGGGEGEAPLITFIHHNSYDLPLYHCSSSLSNPVDIIPLMMSSNIMVPEASPQESFFISSYLLNNSNNLLAAGDHDFNTGVSAMDTSKNQLPAYYHHHHRHPEEDQYCGVGMTFSALLSSSSSKPACSGPEAHFAGPKEQLRSMTSEMGCKKRKRNKGCTSSTSDVETNHEEKDDHKRREVVHVRAKRGQATDSHSLAERVRRERINEKLRVLQDLVPGCYKTMGMAVMLDVIINYVQSLQNQIEFLSMKLSAASLFYDFNSPEAEAVEALQLRTNNYESREMERDNQDYGSEGINTDLNSTWPF